MTETRAATTSCVYHGGPGVWPVLRVCSALLSALVPKPLSPQISISPHAGDDGNAFNGSGTGRAYGPTFGAGDTIGVLFNRVERTIRWGAHQLLRACQATCQGLSGWEWRWGSG